MNPDTITTDVVRDSLRAIRTARSLDDSLLLRLNLLGQRLASEHMSDTPSARAGLLPRLLEEVTADRLARERGQAVPSQREVLTAEHALEQLVADYQSHSLDREAWGILFFRFFSGSRVTLHEVADLLGLSYQTVRRRAHRGIDALTDALADMERSAATAVTRGHNVPEPLTRFIGRDQELADIRRLLAAHRLVTLTGPGGIGKSRLAVHLAHDLAADFDDGVWFVELTALSDGGQVPQAVVDALGLSEQPAVPLATTLTGHLTTKRTLLVLDNCEHVVQAASDLVGTLLGHCPSLQVLATSREELHVDGQALFAVPPMALPTAAIAGTVAGVVHVDAVRLFRNRASAARPGFKVHPGNTPQVTRICTTLDGIPLAIELAAARLRFLALDQLEDRLADRFQLLKDGRYASRPSHETLEATMDWSYGLLTEDEQALLRRLSVFRGGWTLEAAEAVSAGDGIDEGDVLELLTQLAAKSLVETRHTELGPRYRMLSTVRLYARDRLVDEGDADRVRVRHLRHYQGLAEEADEHIFGPEQAAWLARLEADEANMASALRWAAATGRVEHGYQLGGAMIYFWLITGRFGQGRELLEGLLARDHAAEPTRQRQIALNATGALADQQSDYAEARRLYEASLAICEALSLQSEMGGVLNNLADLVERDGDRDLARSQYERALAIFRAEGELRKEAAVLQNLGQMAEREANRVEASRLIERSVEIERELGNSYGVAHALLSLGRTNWYMGEYAAARTCVDECLEISHEVGADPLTADALMLVSMDEIRLGDFAAAGEHLETAAAMLQAMGNRKQLGLAHANIGHVQAEQGDLETALQSHRRSLAILQGIGDQDGVAFADSNIGDVQALLGDFAASARAHQRSLELRTETDIYPSIARSMAGVAFLAAITGEPQTAAKLAGAAFSMRGPFGTAGQLRALDRLGRTKEIARRSLGEDLAEAADEEGRAMPFDDAIELAFDVLAAISESTEAAANRP